MKYFLKYLKYGLSKYGIFKSFSKPAKGKYSLLCLNIIMYDDIIWYLFIYLLMAQWLFILESEQLHGHHEQNGHERSLYETYNSRKQIQNHSNIKYENNAVELI